MMMINDLTMTVYKQEHQGEKSLLPGSIQRTLKFSCNTNIRTNVTYFLLTNLKYAHFARFKNIYATLIAITMPDKAIYHLMQM